MQPIQIRFDAEEPVVGDMFDVILSRQNGSLNGWKAYLPAVLHKTDIV